MHIILAFLLLFVCEGVNSGVSYERSTEGDFYVYIPEQKPKNILVIAHGMLSKNQKASEVAEAYISRWIHYAKKHSLLLIAPVFDTERFGNLKGGYGGYRNLFGKIISADAFVNKLVDRYSSDTLSASSRFYLYGHSAGGQFVSRYIVTHPNRVIRAVISAAGRYSYPNKAIKWPYGAGDLSKTIEWEDASKTKISVRTNLENYALAARKVSIVIGSKDIKIQPERAAHIGSTRIEIAKSWAQYMNQNAKTYGIDAEVNVHIIPGIGHSSSELTYHCANVLFEN